MRTGISNRICSVNLGNIRQVGKSRVSGVSHTGHIAIKVAVGNRVAGVSGQQVSNRGELSSSIEVAIRMIVHVGGVARELGEAENRCSNILNLDQVGKGCSRDITAAISDVIDAGHHTFAGDSGSIFTDNAHNRSITHIAILNLEGRVEGNHFSVGGERNDFVT